MSENEPLNKKFTTSAQNLTFQNDAANLNFSGVPQNLSFSLAVGTFAQFVVNADTGFLSDSEFRTFFKTLADNFAATELTTLVFTKALSDTPTAADEALRSVTKALADTPVATDLMARSLSRPGVADAATVSDIRSTHLNKHAFDAVNLTDDIDGAASIDDDQEIQFFKSRSESIGVTDAAVRLFSMAIPNEQASITDTGLLRSQGYTTDFSYFLEDYVGVSRTL